MTKKPTLLYAEDNKESRENYAFILEEYFSEIYLASNGKEALKLFQQHHPDILLLDISMPLLNGLDLVKIIRKEHPNIPIVMLTAHADKEKLLKAVSLKLDGYLLKPVDVSELQETLLAQIRKLMNNQCILLDKELLWDGNELQYKNHIVKLTKKEHLLMQHLCRTPGRYISHDELILHIWNDEMPNFSHNKKLVQLIYRLNKKLSEIVQENIHIIENSYTHGYRICEPKD